MTSKNKAIIVGASIIGVVGILFGIQAGKTSEIRKFLSDKFTREAPEWLPILKQCSDSEAAKWYSIIKDYWDKGKDPFQSSAVRADSIGEWWMQFKVKYKF